MPQLELTTTIKDSMRMSCVRNFVFSMLYLLASGQPIWGLTVSSQTLELDVGGSDLYNGSSSSASVGVLAQNLTIPPDPFVFEASGYKVVYRLRGEGYIQVISVMRLLAKTRHLLEERQRAAGADITDPIPGGRVQESVLDLGRNATWEIHQVGRIPEALSYQHVQIALEGTEELTRAYQGLVRQYAFSLVKPTRSNMQFMATGSLSRPQDAATD